MTIYRCDKCSRENDDTFPPCIFIDSLHGKIDDASVCLVYTDARRAEWEKCDKMPEDVEL